jgi:hypothetical protein
MHKASLSKRPVKKQPVVTINPDNRARRRTIEVTLLGG